MSGRIEIEYDDGRLHESVQVAAEFTDWEAVPLGLDVNTRYAAVFDGAQAAELYHYKFIVDGQWSLLPGLETIHDRAGNVNHFAVAKPIPASEKQQGYAPRQDEGFSTPRGYGSAAVGGGQFGGPAEAAVRQAPGRTTRDDFQNVTGFNPQRDQTARSADAAQDISAANLQSEPYEFVKGSSSSFGANVDADRSAGLGYGTEYGRDARNYEDDTRYEQRLTRPLDSVGSQIGSAPIRQPEVVYEDVQVIRPDGVYEYEDVQITRPDGTVEYEDVRTTRPDGAVEYKDIHASRPDGTVEYSDAQVTGADGIAEYEDLQVAGRDGVVEFTDAQYANAEGAVEYTDVQGATAEGAFENENFAVIGVEKDASQERQKKPDTGYEYTAGQLLEPEEDILEGQQRFAKPNTGYEYTESELSKPKEAVKGYKSPPSKLDTRYEYTDSELPQPQEKVAETPDDEYADAFEDASMPGSLPFERKVLGGRNVPANAQDIKPSNYATETAKKEDKPVGVKLLEEDTVEEELPAERSFYETVEEQLEEEDAAIVEPRELDERTGLPESTSDRTLSKSAPYDPESGLDREAALRAVEQEQPSTPPSKERKAYYEPESYASSYSPQHHQPIDVNTGFPVDYPEVSRQPSARSHGPSLRNHDHRRSLKSRSEREQAPPITSQEHRNAAVIAAASRASAFARQDVAAIPGRGDSSYRPGHSSPGISRGNSVRSREAPREQPTYANSSPPNARYSAPAYATAAAQKPRPTSTITPTAATPTVAGPVVADPVAASTVPAAATSGINPGASIRRPGTADSLDSNFSSDGSLQRTESRKEGRFKRLFKFH